MDKESALFYVVLLLFAVTGIVTILGLVQKVSIDRKYLNALFAALILELVAAVLYLFSNTDFFARAPNPDELVIVRAQLPAAHKDVSSETLLQLLGKGLASSDELERLQAELMALRERIDAQVPPYDDVTLALDAKIREIAELEKQQAQLLSQHQGNQKLEKQFLVRMAIFNSKISEWGTSINLLWKSDEKREIAGMLQEAFKQIGFMPADQTPDDDPIRAHDLLVDYQVSKDFGETGFLTSEVVAFIIRDYLTPVSLNGQVENDP